MACRSLAVKNPREGARGPEPFRTLIIPDGRLKPTGGQPAGFDDLENRLAYGGTGAVFAPGTPIPQGTTASLQFPPVPQSSAGKNWRGWLEAQYPQDPAVSPKAGLPRSN